MSCVLSDSGTRLLPRVLTGLRPRRGRPECHWGWPFGRVLMEFRVQRLLVIPGAAEGVWVDVWGAPLPSGRSSHFSHDRAPEVSGPMWSVHGGSGRCLLLAVSVLFRRQRVPSESPSCQTYAPSETR